MNETPFFFASGGFNLFGVLHSPEVAKRRLPYLFCPSFGEEKLWAHLVYVNFARELASRGHPVLRFDYRGTGDSDGDFEDSTVETYLADIRCAIDVLVDRVGASMDVGLLGLRFGATLAALTAESVAEVRQLVMWSPVVDGAAYMQELLRVNLAMQMAMYREVRQGREALIQAMAQGQNANVDGYEIAEAMFKQVSSIQLLDGERRSKAKCLIVQIGQGSKPILEKRMSELCSLYPHGRAVVSAEEPFWKEIKSFYSRAARLYDDTLNWLEKNENEL